MSWLARTIANSLKLDDDDDDEHVNNINRSTNTTNSESPSKAQTDLNQRIESQSQSTSPSNASSSATPTAKGVKEDLSELTKTLTRQFWGVASFLAPPPEPSDQPERRQPTKSVSDESQDLKSSDQFEPLNPSDPEISDEALIAGIRSDIAEIGGRFKIGISKLSNNATVSEFTKIASNFLQFGAEEESPEKYEIGNAVGVTEEVVAFVKDIAMHPETWLDFPLPDDEAFDDFDMSDAQQEHALAVEHLAPSLAALRIELCPGCMNEGCFWKIYFVLLHPRLNKHDAELLSTPQILEARTSLTQGLQNRGKGNPEPDYSGIGTSYARETTDLSREESLSVPMQTQTSPEPLRTSSIQGTPSTAERDFETEKHPVESGEMQIIDKSVIEEEAVKETKHQHSSGSSIVVDEKFEDDGDDWLKEESSEVVNGSGAPMSLGNDEDVSFSDLEEEDEDVPSSYKKGTSGSDSSAKDSRDWVQLSRSAADSVKDVNVVDNKHLGSEKVSAHKHVAKESNDWLDVDDIDVM